MVGVVLVPILFAAGCVSVLVAPETVSFIVITDPSDGLPSVTSPSAPIVPYELVSGASAVGAAVIAPAFNGVNLSNCLIAA